MSDLRRVDVSSAVEELVCGFDVGLGAATPHTGPGDDGYEMQLEVFRPDGAPIAVLCCLAGGGVNRRYWDLDVPGASSSHSFARTMVARGHAVVLADHLGVGDSSKPAPLTLSVEVLAAAQHAAFGAVLRDFGGVPAIGVGHSMGSMLTAIQQAHHHTYMAIALTGFANRGLPDFVPPDLVPFVDDPIRLRAELPRVLAQRAPAAPPSGVRPARPVLFHGSKLAPEVNDAVKAIAAPAPPLAAALSMVPGSIRPEMEMIDVPVLIANGDLDITGPIDDIPAGFPSAPRVDTVVLPETAHSHHAFPGRTTLYDALDRWIRSLLV